MLAPPVKTPTSSLGLAVPAAVATVFAVFALVFPDAVCPAVGVPEHCTYPGVGPVFTNRSVMYITGAPVSSLTPGLTVGASWNTPAIRFGAPVAVASHWNLSLVTIAWATFFQYASSPAAGECPIPVDEVAPESTWTRRYSFPVD